MSRHAPARRFLPIAWLGAICLAATAAEAAVSPTLVVAGLTGGRRVHQTASVRRRHGLKKLVSLSQLDPRLLAELVAPTLVSRTGGQPSGGIRRLPS